MKLRHVILHPGESHMEVLVEDSQGKVRRVELRWYAKVQLDTPPANWWEMVQAEVEMSRATELAAKMGRTTL